MVLAILHQNCMILQTLKHSKSLTLIIMLSVVLVGCKKKDEKPEPPTITFKSISHDNVEQFNNTVSITFSYEDYQGDLGETDPDAYSVRVKDDRLADYDWYHVPPMTPELKELHIKGDYALELSPLFILGNGSEEQTHFSIQIKDRAGNWSNTITTPVVIIHN